MADAKIKTRRPAKPRVSKAIAARERSARALDADAVVSLLKKMGDGRVRDDMAKRYGIRLPDPRMAFGVKMAAMQQLAKRIKSGDAKSDHRLALALWRTKYYEARTVAALLDEPGLVTPAQMDRWCREFDNWAICDTVCFKLFDRVDPSLAFSKVEQWADRRDEFVKRAAFALLASLALHDRHPAVEPFARGLKLIESAAVDDRNFVKKGVSWALRSVGRRPPIRTAAIELARRLAASDTPSCRWIGKDALRDLAPP